MIYLGRPVFLFDINWADPVNKSFLFDLAEVAIGFGAEVFSPLQQHVVQGHTVSCELKTIEDVDAFDDFTAALGGRLQGFWLPAPFAAVKFKAAVDATHFDIEDQGLRNTWNDHPDIYLAFAVPGAALQIAKITNVAVQGSGERITLNAALNPQPTAGTMIYRLPYVRLAEDIERGTVKKEGHMTRELRVVELPLEYIDYETGSKPIYLYRLFMNAPATYEWRFTSFAADVVSGNKLYSKFAMLHRSLSSSARPQTSTLEIEAAHDPEHPFALFLPIAPQRPMNIEVSSVPYADPDTQTLLFAGKVKNVDDQGDRLVATCDSWWNILNRKIAAGDDQAGLQLGRLRPKTCKVIRAGLKPSRRSCRSTRPRCRRPSRSTCFTPRCPNLANWITDDWFANGFLELGFGLEFEARTITASEYVSGAGRIQLTLNTPLRFAEVGDWMQLMPGCDGTWEQCDTKFGNSN
jgi:hypothetical protein